MTTDERERTVRRLLPLVRRIARRVARVLPGCEFDDLIGDGCVGLLRAVDAFDPTYGTSIEQYARRVVLGSMLNGVRRLDPVSERVRRIVRHAERERYAIAAATGRLPSMAELERQRPALARARASALRASALSLDAPLPTGVAPPADDRGADPARVVADAAERRRIHAAIDALPPRQRSVVVAHYFGEHPLRAIGEHMRVSPQRASQLHLLAIRRLRRDLTPA
jgi:RNA polymerase sigma factor for flagellar operon FliA